MARGIHLHRKDFFFEIRPCGQKVIFVTEIVILSKNFLFYWGELVPNGLLHGGISKTILCDICTYGKFQCYSIFTGCLTYEYFPYCVLRVTKQGLTVLIYILWNKCILYNGLVHTYFVILLFFSFLSYQHRSKISWNTYFDDQRIYMFLIRIIYMIWQSAMSKLFKHP